MRATLMALVILNLGQVPPAAAAWINLKRLPDVPVFLVVTLVWLWLFWSYLAGRGWPRRTGAARRRDLRAERLPAATWLWSLIAGGLGMISVLNLALFTGRVATLPAAAYEPPFDLAPYPWWSVAAFFLSLAVTAGVVEEAAFRGYMLSQIERRHGWAIGIALVAVLFYVAHLGHAYATLAFAPFFAAYSLLHGLLVAATRSILPSVLLHAAGDVWILPIQYGVLPLPLGEPSMPYLALSAAAGGLSVAAFVRLRRATAGEVRRP